MAAEYGTRPSELLGIVDPRPAFLLDHALFVKHRLFLSEQDPDGPRTRFREQGYEAPDRKVLTEIPWGGPGPDPLRGI